MINLILGFPINIMQNTLDFKKLFQKSQDNGPRRKALTIAIGIRNDGTMVVSKNGSDFKPNPLIHAERRLLKKGGMKSVTVLRFNRDGELKMSKPCIHCAKALKLAGVDKVYYSGYDGQIYRKED